MTLPEVGKMNQEDRYKTSQDYRDGYDLGRQHGREDILVEVLLMCRREIDRSYFAESDASSAYRIQVEIHKLKRELEAGL